MGQTVKPINQTQVYSVECAVKACAQNSDTRSKEWLYKKFYGYLLAVSLRYVKNREDAEELVNECFVKVFSKINTFAGSSNPDSFEKLFRGWMAKICVNVSIDFLRTKKMFFSDDELPEESLTWSQADTATGLNVQDIFKLLERLSEIQRTIFNMYEIEGYSHEEIAKKLEIPESTSRTYLARAKQRLKELYSEWFSVPR